MKITPGKQKGMKAVSDARGVIAAAAMDQRGSLKSAIAKEKGIDKKDVSAQMMEEFKTAVVRVLTPHASAILLDPEYGLPAAKVRAKNAGLLLAYENSGYDNTRPGRLPDLLDIWSVRRLVAAGADCIKILLYYTPFDPKAIDRAPRKESIEKLMKLPSFRQAYEFDGMRPDDFAHYGAFKATETEFAAATRQTVDFVRMTLEA